MKTVKAGMTLDTIVMGSMCDESSLMSIPALLDAFQDIAGVHAATAETGVLQLEDKGLFWVVSKMRMVIKRSLFRILLFSHLRVKLSTGNM